MEEKWKEFPCCALKAKAFLKAGKEMSADHRCGGGGPQHGVVGGMADEGTQTLFTDLFLAQLHLLLHLSQKPHSL